MTKVVIESLEQRLTTLKREEKGGRRRLVEDIMNLGKECADLPILDERDIDDILYDENGIPQMLK